MIIVFLADGFEEVEALTPVDLLRRAGEDVRTVAVGTGGSREVAGSHQIRVICDMAEEEVRQENVSMVIIPGGVPGTPNLEKSDIVKRMLQYAINADIWIGAICAAPSVLGHMGALHGRQVICYPGYEDQLAGAVISKNAVCRDGKLVTAKGAGVALEFGLELVSCLKGGETSAKMRAALQCQK